MIEIANVLEDMIYNYIIHVLVFPDSISVCFANSFFVGIPMGTNGVPLFTHLGGEASWA